MLNNALYVALASMLEAGSVFPGSRVTRWLGYDFCADCFGQGMSEH